MPPKPLTCLSEKGTLSQVIILFCSSLHHLNHVAVLKIVATEECHLRKSKLHYYQCMYPTERAHRKRSERKKIWKWLLPAQAGWLFGCDPGLVWTSTVWASPVVGRCRYTPTLQVQGLKCSHIGGHAADVQVVVMGHSNSSSGNPNLINILWVVL